MAMKNLEDLYPLSPAQEGMLFHTLYAPSDAAVYVEQFCCLLTGPLQVEAFKQAWQGVVDRHPSLRTAFLSRGLKRPLQAVRQKVTLPIHKEDWRELEPAAAEARLEELLETDRRRGFDPARAPLLRLTLVALGDERRWLVWTFHHLVLDGWSVPRVLSEVQTLYAAATAGSPPRLPPVRPYRQYVEWLQGRDPGRSEAFWRRELAGFTEPTALGVDADLTAGGWEPAGWGYGARQLALAPAVTAALEETARGRRLTPFLLLQAAWGLLLSRYSGEVDVLFGVTVAGRPEELSGSQEMVGLFLNTLPVRLEVDPALPLERWLARLRERWLALTRHQHTPLPRIREWAQVPGERPLFESLLVFENAPPFAGGGALAPGLELSQVRTYDRTNYPLTLLVIPGPELTLRALFDRPRLDPVAVQRLLGHLAVLLAGMAARPGDAVGRLPLLTAPERQQLLVEENDTAGNPGEDPWRVIRRWRRTAPDVVAVATEEERLSYAGLLRRAHGLARELGRRGVGLEVAVGVQARRSPEAIVAMTGLLAADGVCVPLDPSYPEERRAFMAQDAALPLLLTDDPATAEPVLAAVAAEGGRPPQVLHLRPGAGEWAQPDLEEEGEPPSRAQAENTVYLLYTSGSTGRPKGVIQTRGAMANLVAWHLRCAPLAPGQPTLQFAPLSFDVSFQEILTTLGGGGTLVLAEEATRRDPTALWRLLARQRIARLFVPFVALEALATAAPEALSPGLALEQVITAGEALRATASLRSLFQRLGPDCFLENHYGPSEAHVVTAYRLAPDPRSWQTLPSIGPPITNLEVYVVDPAFEAVPLGVPGELACGGLPLARGYHRRIRLTAGRFVPHPESRRGGRRLYLTGDRARVRPDGRLDFLGRLDDQVKVRGVRIELGEVESALEESPAVHQAVVVARGEGGGRRLVAYVVPRRPGEIPEVTRGPHPLRDFLLERLPEPMVPSLFVPLAALPLTPSGKVNRRGLPAPSQIRAEAAAAAAEPPRTPTEELVAGIWGEMLEVGRVSRQDRFFDLGGHSLVAVQVAQRLAAALGVEPPLELLFNAPSLADFAAGLDELRQAGGGNPPPPVEPVPREGPLPVSFTQERVWFLQQLDPGSPAYNVPAPVALRGELRAADLAASLARVVARHEILRTVFDLTEGRPVQVVLPRLVPPLPVVDLSGLESVPGGDDDARAAAERLTDAEARRPFDLARGPLLRATLLRLAEGEHRLLLTQHHAITDLWSMGLLLAELAAGYDARVAGQELRRPAPALQYADFAAWQRGWLQGERVDGLVEHWRRRLAGAPVVLELPTDRPRLPVQSYRGNSFTHRLPAPLVGEIRAVARRQGVTLFMFLAAALGTLLGRHAGQREVVLGTPVAGRTRRELEGLLGVIINTLVLRVDRSGDPSFQALLAAVRAEALEAFAHQELPFELLVERLRPGRDTGRTPLFQVLLSLQNAPLPEIAFTDLDFTLLPVSTGTAKFDLTFTCQEVEGELAVSLEHNSDLFDATTARRLLGQLAELARGAAAAPERAVSGLPLLGPAESHQLLREWQGPPPPSHPATLTDLVAAQVARRPEAVAVSAGEERLSFRELDRAAGALARSLAGRGVGPETVAGVSLRRSPRGVVALLGVLQAGGIYLPVDPDYPQTRRRFMLEDSGARLLLTEADLEGRIGGAGDPPPASSPAFPSANSPLPGHLAYVIYTSGSTGRPKGVAVEHGPAAIHFVALARAYRLTPSDRVLHFFSTSFDGSLEVFLSTLGAGAALVLRGEEPWSPDGLTRRLARLTVTVANLPAAYWRQWVRDYGAGDRSAALRGQPALRLLIAGGEAMAPEAARLWPATPAGRAAALANGYGPTEAVVTATLHPVPPAAGDREHVPIGRLLAGRRGHVLDPAGRPAPPGVPGELHLGGLLARGYLGRPGLTAERFLPDPWSPEAGGRLYRTGDRVRRLAGGELDYLGRVDHQVKLRGFRIELGEVEAALGRHPEVERAAAVVRRDGEGDDRLVAYLVPRGKTAPAPGELRGFLRRELPEPMLPSAFIPLASLPLTASGKLDHGALPALGGERPELAAAFAPPGSAVERRISEIWQQALGVERVGVHDNFFDLGGHSLLLTRVHGPVCQALGREISLIDLFRYPTVSVLATLARGGGGGTVEEGEAEAPDREARQAAPRRRAAPAGGEIAVLGMACRFPGAAGVEELWANLRAGVESVRFFSRRELLAAGADPRDLAEPGYVPANAVLDGIELFDAGFFGFTPREAALMDPQHRLFLECAWEAFEDACLDPSRGPGRVGVYAGEGLTYYLIRNVLASPEARDPAAGFQVMIGNHGSFLPTQVSYRLDLKGPSVHVQTACSTSLVAVHLACRALLEGECDLALAGGVTVSLPQVSGYFFHPGGVHAPDGHCRAFDADGRGFVPGNGAGVVLLKPLAAALADGDPVRAVIKGSAVNNDGSYKIGFTAPSIDGQAAVIREALEAAAVDPATVTAIEAHGTGTELGDPVEVAALTQVFGRTDGERPACALGSVKTNLGHTDAAAGVAGLIKAVLMLEHGRRVPSLHFRRPNPEIDFEAGPFYVQTEDAPWPRGESPRRAGVSSFGLGGTNAHLVLEEAPPRPRPPRPQPNRRRRPWQLLTLSAREPAALEQATRRLAERLGGDSPPELADVAFTLHLGRKAFEHRRIAVCRDEADAARVLAAGDPERVLSGRVEGDRRPVVFLLPGGGAQYPGMGRGLYEEEPVFRREVERCAEIVAAREGYDLLADLYPGEGEMEAAAERLRGTSRGLPALFAVEIALARLWQSWGVRPAAMIGHSLGEYTAAALAGVFSLEDALALVALRGRLFERLPAGAMLSLPLDEEELAPWLGEELSIAALNGPGQSVLSGSNPALDDLARRLDEAGIEHRRIHIDVAAHSHLVEPILGELAAFVAGLDLAPPRLPYLSNVTGDWITPGEATDPAYWARHLRRTVRFGAGVERLLAEPQQLFLEVGPGHTLSSLVRRHPRRRPGQESLPSLRHPQDPQPDEAFLATSLGRLWLAGGEVDWRAFHAHEPGRRVPLPRYPFQRRRHWIEPEAGAGPAPRISGRSAHPGKGADPGGWLYLPAWRPAPPPVPADLTPRPRRILLLADAAGLGHELEARLESRGHEVTRIPAGESFEPGLRKADPPEEVLHLRGVTGGESLTLESCLEDGFYSLLELGQALVRRAPGVAVRLTLLTTGLHAVSGGELLAPGKAAALGLLRVLSQEYPDLTCRTIDLTLPPAGSWQRQRLLDHLVAEVEAPAAAGGAQATGGGLELAVAYREAGRWVQTLAPAPLPPAPAPVPRLRRRGVYLLTGGLGRIGLTLAEHLARSVQARLVLVSRRVLPPREEWEDDLAHRGEADPTGRLLRRLLALEEAGGQVTVHAADVADREALEGVLRWVDQHWGELHGVIHAAGVTSADAARPLQELDRQACRLHFRPKVQALPVLEEALRGRRLDFCLLCSSLSSVLGGLGLGAYAAANRFMDAFAQAHNRRYPTPWTSVAWDVWELGETDPAASPLGASIAGLALTPDEGVEVLDRLLALGPLDQALISTGDLQARLAWWTGRSAASAGPPARLAPEPLSAETQSQPRPSPTAGDDDIEDQVAAIWAQLFGIEHVGRHDNFFHLGGHSLLAVQCLNRLHRTFQVELPVRSLFENPTVARFAQVIREALGQQPEPAAQPSPERETPQPTADETTWRQRLAAAEPRERPHLLRTYLRRRLATALGTTSQDLPADHDPAGDLLAQAATDLIMHLRRDFGLQLFPREIHQRPHLADLATYIDQELAELRPRPPLDPEPSPPTPAGGPPGGGREVPGLGGPDGASWGGRRPRLEQHPQTTNDPGAGDNRRGTTPEKTTSRAVPQPPRPDHPAPAPPGRSNVADQDPRQLPPGGGREPGTSAVAGSDPTGVLPAGRRAPRELAPFGRSDTRGASPPPSPSLRHTGRFSSALAVARLVGYLGPLLRSGPRPPPPACPRSLDRALPRSPLLARRARSPPQGTTPAATRKPAGTWTAR